VSREQRAELPETAHTAHHDRHSSHNTAGVCFGFNWQCMQCCKVDDLMAFSLVIATAQSLLDVCAVWRSVAASKCDKVDSHDERHCCSAGRSTSCVATSARLSAREQHNATAGGKLMKGYTNSFSSHPTLRQG